MDVVAMTNEEVYEKLFSVLLKGGMAQIAKVIHELFGRPVLIISVEYKVLVQNPNVPIGDLIWDTLWQHKKVPLDLVWQFKMDGYIKEVDNSETALFVNWGVVKSLPRIMANFKVNGVIKGYIGILFPDGQCTKRHLQIADLICQTIGLEFQKQNNFSETKPSMQNVLLKALFQGEVCDTAILAKWRSYTNISLEKNFCVVAVQARSTSAEGSLIPYLKKSIDENCRYVYTVILKDTLLLLYTMIPDQLSYAEASQNLMQKVFELLDMEMFVRGVSDVFSNVLELGVHKYQAMRALKLGSLHTPGRLVYHYHDYILEDIFSYALKSMDRSTYVHPAIPQLTDYDRDNHTDYLNTLKNYIRSMCNSAKTAQHLNIHRNTLLYRIQKIEKMTGIDLDDERTCAQLLCNFYMVAGDSKEHPGLPNVTKVH